MADWRCMGTVTTNSVPFPDWTPLNEEERSISKASNRRLARLSVMPIPLSFTRNSYRPKPSLSEGFSESFRDTAPPSGVNLQALLKRFMTTRLKP